LKTGGKVVAINEVTEVYNPPIGFLLESMKNLKLKVYPNPSQDIIAIQSDKVLLLDMQAELIDASGKLVESKVFVQGTSICYFDTSILYNGLYTIRIYNSLESKNFKVLIQ
jgi:hypothetical protein